jgi:hypothetical protein
MRVCVRSSDKLRLCFQPTYEELKPALAPEAPYAPDAEGFRRHLALIKHCVEKELIVQAVILGRERLVS